MATRSKRKKSRKKATQAPTPVNCTALMVVDNHPIRRKFISGCKRSMSAMHKAQGEWEEYQNEDLPAYRAWYSSSFGKELSKIRELDQQLQEANQIIALMRHLVYTENLSEAEAYRKALDMRANPDKYKQEHESRDKAYEHEENPGAEDFEPDFEEPETSAEEKTFYERLREYLKELGPIPANQVTKLKVNELFRDFIWGEPDIDEFIDDTELMGLLFARFRDEFFEHQIDSSTEHPEVPEGETPESLELKLKASYRRLVRLLHPDFRKDDDERLNELWHQVQDAYQEKNLERLDMLSAYCDIYQGNFDSSLPISQIAAVQEEYRRQTRSFRKEINRAKKGFEWGFRKRKNHQKIKKAISRDLKGEISDSERELTRFKNTFKYWEGLLEKADNWEGQVKTQKPKPRPMSNAKPKPRNHKTDPSQAEFTFS